MAFRAAFIGINTHRDPGIPELNGAVRDAKALHALFCDTFDDIRASLLVDEQATTDAVRGELDEVLDGANPDDVVVLTFAGHGTPGHQLVLYDTDRSSPGDTTSPLEELASRFQKTRARAVLCVVDACFSGAAPARVLEGLPIARAPLADFSAFEGKGRFLLAAATPTQPAWEEPGTGHGLLTHAVIDVLTAGTGTINLVSAVGEIIARTKIAAERIGEKQDACFVGGTEGHLELPVLRKGSRWLALYPDYSLVEAGEDVADLAKFGIPDAIVSQWRERFPRLNALQLEAVNRHRVLNGSSLLVVAPTSSGKTFVGEMAAAHAAFEGKKAVFLLPYRALVNEKHEDFLATYGSIGLRVIRCSGDYTDETGLFLSGRYDIALLTYEMFLGMAVGSAHVLRRLGAIVIDEAQFVTDPGRGISVELILTLVLAARKKGVSPQLVALSAVIGDINSFDEWLGCARLVWTERPVPLIEGVLDRSGILEKREPDGRVSQVQLLPRGSIVQRRDEPSAQDVIVPLARQLIAQGEKIIVFRNARGPAEGCALYLARELGLPPASAALDALPTHDPTNSSARLRECLAGGTAFHNTNLRRNERVVIERSFRDRQGAIHALGATTTLAAGINTPASTVILAEQEFVGEDGRPFTVAEYKNMAGRAGRLGYNETGKAIILATTPLERHQLFQRYVLGSPEPIRSSFNNRDLRTWIIRLLSQVRAIKQKEIPELLENTYGGFLSAKADPGWRDRAAREIASTIERFLELRLLEAADGQVQLTLLGRACGQSSLSFDSAMRLVEALRLLSPDELTPFNLVGLLQALPEADAIYTPVRKRGRTESARINDARSRFGPSVVRALQHWAADEIAFWARCKRAAVIADWMDGVPVQDIEARFNIPFGGQIQYGHIQGFADGTRFYLASAHQIISASLLLDPSKEAEFETVLQQLEFGVRPEFFELMRAPFHLSRGECLVVVRQGIQTASDLRGATRELLVELLGAARASSVLPTFDQNVVAEID